MAHLTGSAPVLLTADLALSIAFWQDKLGFALGSTFGDPPSFALLVRDGLIVMLGRTEEGVAITPHWKLRPATSNVYFWVDDVDDLYAEFIRQKGLEPDWDLCEQPYGVKEFGIQDPNGYDIAFGQVLSAAPA